MRTLSRTRFVTAFRPWSSAPDDARLRRPTDILLLIGSTLVAIAIGITLRAQAPATPTKPGATTISDIVTWLADTIYGLVAAWALVLLLLPLFSRGRRRR